MILTWLTFINILCTISVAVRHATVEDTTHNWNPDNWKAIEALAEQHPYIVALLNDSKTYICTGTIIGERTIITSGNCVQVGPKYVAVGTAVFSKKIQEKNLLSVASTVSHGDYAFELKESDLNVTKLHSNLGLLFVTIPILEWFIASADMGNYYATELKDKKLNVVGFGKINKNGMIALQTQTYHQMPCSNPKWYYCVCGIEYTAYTNTYLHEFGNGGPVMLGTEVVGIAAAPSGKLSLRNIGVKYNIFTVIGPYISWVEKQSKQSVQTFRAHKSHNNANVVKEIFVQNTVILILISKLLN